MAFQGDTQGQIQDFLKILRRRVPQVLLVTAFVSTLGVCAAVLVPKKYVKEQRVELLPTRIEQDPFMRNASQTAINQEASNAEYHLKNHARVRQVLEELDWPDYSSLIGREQAEYVGMVIDNIDVTVLQKLRNEGSTFVDVSYADVHPGRTVQLLRRLIEVWIEDVVDRDRQLLEEEAKQARDDRQTIVKAHEEAAEERKRILRELGIPSIAPGIPMPVSDPVFEELTRIQAEQEKLRESLTADRALRASLQEALDATPATLAVTEPAPRTSNAAAVAQLESELSLMKRTLDKFKPAHSMYRRTLQEIEAVEEQIASAKALQQPDESITTYRANPERAQLQTRVDELGATIHRAETLLAELDRKELEFAQRHEERLELFTELELLDVELESLAERRIAADAEFDRKNSAFAALRRTSGVPFRIEGEWDLPISPSEPNPYLIGAFSVVAGLALGLVVAFLGEFTKNCYRSVNDISRVMSAPVLGIINTIVTPRELRRSRTRALVVTASTLLLMGGMAWLTWAYTAAPDLLGTEIVQRIDDVRMMFR